MSTEKNKKNGKDFFTKKNFKKIIMIKKMLNSFIFKEKKIEFKKK